MCFKLPMNPTNLMNNCLYRCDIYLVFPTIGLVLIGALPSSLCRQILINCCTKLRFLATLHIGVKILSGESSQSPPHPMDLCRSQPGPWWVAQTSWQSDRAFARNGTRFGNVRRCCNWSNCEARWTSGFWSKCARRHCGRRLAVACLPDLVTSSK